MTAAALPPPPAPLVKVRVWDHVVRATHWIIAVAILVLAVTGFYIGHPFIAVHGEAGRSFVMGTFKVVHFYAAIAFTLAVVTRIAWLFLGTGHAGWRELVPVTKERRRALLHTMAFYAFLRPRPDAATGHNPLAGLAYVAIFGLYLVMITTGLAMYADAAAIGSPVKAFQFFLALWGGAATTRWIHHAVMWLFVAFFFQHVYSAVLTSSAEQNGTLDSIFTGNKWVSREAAAKEPKT